MGHKSKKILVTGGAGYIGSHVVFELVAAGYQPVILDNLSTGDARNCPPEAAFVYGDAGNAALVQSLLVQHGIKAVMHFAGSIRVDESVRDPLKYYANNTFVSSQLLSACGAAGVELFLFSSTAAVYGNVSSAPLNESAPIAPVSPYGMSKRMFEQIVADYARVDPIRYLCFRYFNVAGVHPSITMGPRSSEATHLIRRACQTAIGQRPQLEVFGSDYPTRDGTCVRDYIHVTDLARAHVEALHYLEAGGASLTLNCGYGIGQSVREVVESVKRVAKVDFPVVMRDRRLGDASSVVAATDLIQKVLPNWKPAFQNLDAIVRTALLWEFAQAQVQGQAQKQNQARESPLLSLSANSTLPWEVI